MPYKFGRLPRKDNPRTLNLASFVKPTLLPTPKVWAWEYNIDNWGTMLNTNIGDCTIACAGHMLMEWTSRTYGTFTPTDQQILTAYSAISGYDPSTGNNDNGCAITDVMDYWQNQGIAGHKILAWAQIDQTNLDNIKQAITIFGGIDIGFNVPQSAMDQFDQGKSWDYTGDQNIIGGHSVFVGGYGRLGCTCVTWGRRQPMNWDFWQNYVDESYAIITQDFLDTAQKSPIFGLDLAALQSALAALKAA